MPRIVVYIKHALHMFEQLRQVDVGTMSTAAGFLRFKWSQKRHQSHIIERDLSTVDTSTHDVVLINDVFRLGSLVTSKTGHRARYRDEVLSVAAGNAPWMSLVAYLALRK